MSELAENPPSPPLFPIAENHSPRKRQNQPEEDMSDTAGEEIDDVNKTSSDDPVNAFTPTYRHTLTNITPLTQKRTLNNDV